MQSTLFDVERPLEPYGARKARSARYHAKLAEVLGRGADWEYHGECAALQHATGKCACGQIGLKYLFTLRHTDGRRVVVGSSCINSYEGISPETAARVANDADRLLAAGLDRERIARETARSNDVEKLLADWSDTEFEIDRLCNVWHARHPWQRMPYTIYKRGGTVERFKLKSQGKAHPFCRIPALKTKIGQMKRLAEKLESAKQTLTDVRCHVC